MLTEQELFDYLKNNLSLYLDSTHPHFLKVSLRLRDPSNPKEYVEIDYDSVYIQQDYSED